MNLYGDVARVRELINQFNSCIKVYNQSIDDFFMKISKQKAWECDAANTYVEMCLSDKTKYTDYGESLARFSNELADMASELERTINTSKRGML